jgi:nitroimidazol reductase NimA-like FMN-containing flavoprotein (pyridoxamine 5'-phosphate oxidase superfamily)
MSTPVTTRDERFSEPGTSATPWEETLRVLEGAELFWIATVRADGRPHVTPLVAVWFDGAIHFSTGVGEQKAVNLRRNPHVTLTTGCNTWDAGLDVVVEGDATPVTDNAKLLRLAEVWASKWDGRWQWQVGDGCFRDDHAEEPILVYAVRPERVLAFAKGPFSHTSHRF